MPDQPQGSERERVLDIARGIALILFAFYHQAVDHRSPSFVAAWPIGPTMMRVVAVAAALIPFTVSPWLLSRWRRGPAEALLHWLAGRHQPLFNVR